MNTTNNNNNTYSTSSTLTQQLRLPARKAAAAARPAQIVVALVSGDSTRRELVFEPGVPVPLVQVGSQATAWQVGGVGIAEQHFALAYNGETLFVGATSNASVYLNSKNIAGQGWVAVARGAMIEAGSARLIVHQRSIGGEVGAHLDPATSAVTRVEESTSVTCVLSADVQSLPPDSYPDTDSGSPDSPESDSDDSIVTRIAASPTTDLLSEVVRPMAAVSKTPPSAVTRVADVTVPFAPPTPRPTPTPLPLPSSPKAFGRRLPPQLPEHVAITHAIVSQSIQQALGATRNAALGVRPERYETQLIAPAPRASEASEAGEDSLPATRTFDHLHAVRPLPSDHHVFERGVVRSTHPSGSSGVSIHATASPQMTAAAARNAVTERRRLSTDENNPSKLDVRAMWNSASTVKKASVVLLLPTLILMLIASRAPASAPMHPSSPPIRPVVTTTATATVSASPAMAPVVPPKATAATPKASESAPPPSAPGAGASAPAAPAKSTATAPAAAKEKTAERRALDAAAAGDYAAASEQYAALAKDHPENPAFAEASRIMDAKRKTAP